MMKRISLVLLILSGLIFGCDKGIIIENLTDEEQFEIDLELIDAYLVENEVQDVLIHSSDIRYTINESGSGISPQASDIVNVDYTGKLLESGIVFDSNTSSEFILSQTIAGWVIMVQEMKEGDSFTIYLPSIYAYGRRGSSPNIQPNSVLIFDIKLNRVGG
jgi:FKBP-type peptidyl-prolyl cis-trans isomerase